MCCSLRGCRGSPMHKGVCGPIKSHLWGKHNDMLRGGQIFLHSIQHKKSKALRDWFFTYVFLWKSIVSMYPSLATSLALFFRWISSNCWSILLRYYQAPIRRSTNWATNLFRNLVTTKKLGFKPMMGNVIRVILEPKLRRTQPPGWEQKLVVQQESGLIEWT